MSIDMVDVGLPSTRSRVAVLAAICNALVIVGVTTIPLIECPAAHLDPSR